MFDLPRLFWLCISHLYMKQFYTNMVKRNEFKIFNVKVEFFCKERLKKRQNVKNDESYSCHEWLVIFRLIKQIVYI